MTDPSAAHPSEDELTSFAVEGGDAGIKNHVVGCDSCRRFVADIAALRASLNALDNDEPSSHLGRRIAFRPPASPSTALIDSFLGILLRTPAVLPLVVFIYIVLAFFIFNYLNDLTLVK